MWSLLDGSGSGKQYAERAVEIGQHSLAITDHGTLAGALEHVQACSDAGIFPILGVEAYFRDNRLDHTPVVIEVDGKKKSVKPKHYHLTLLAMNAVGWKNLQAITSESYVSGFYHKPTVDWDLLSRYNEGIYVLGGCIGGMFSNLVLKGDEPEVAMWISKMRSIVGDRFSFEIMPHDFDDQRTVNIATIRVANEFGIPIAATGDAHYPYVEWASTQDTLLMLSTNQSNEKRRKLLEKKKEAEESDSGEDIKIYSMLKENPTLYLMSEHDMMLSFARFHPDLPTSITDAAIDHTGEIISGFTPFMLDRGIKMPKLTRKILCQIDDPDPGYAMELAHEGEEYANAQDMELVKNTLRGWCTRGLNELKDLYPSSHWFKYPISKYEEQIEHEFDTFDQIGDHVWRYMVMVAGEIRWAREQGVIVGPGRGSAAGSLVAYLSGITDIDPIPYGLMFERFINPNRKGMPDIDVDFMPGKLGRDRVKQHTANVYGDANVVDIAAYQTYGPKAALRAVCRVFDNEISYEVADRYVKVLDILKPTEKIDLEECAERFPEIDDFRKKYPTLWREAIRIEGHPYAFSKHASGVVVKPNHIDLPTASRKNEDTGERVKVTAWPDTHELLAGYGFLKIDYLVIEGLVRQYEIMKALAERENSPVDLRTLPVRWDPEAVDPGVMEQFAKGMTLGVWQFEGKGTIPVLKSVKPTNMHDIAAINALIRPGPRGAGMTEEYAKRKNGEHPIEYWHESVEYALKPTLGLMLYQEQAMEISVALGGFTRTEADDLRKAMGKKYREGMEAVKKFLRDLGFFEKFVDNATDIVGGEMADTIWNAILAFGGYSFNASHAYAYGLISYHDMYLKTLAPADFYAQYLSSAKSKDLPSKLAGTMREGSRFDINIKPPDINKSGYGFTVLDRHTILYGIEAVKGIGPSGSKAIFDNRPYKDYPDFDSRVPRKDVKAPARKALIGCGAFDEFNLRAMMSPQERASNEIAFIGVKLSGEADTKKYAELIEETIHPEEEFDAAQHGEHMCVGGEITGVKRVTTKKGDPMGFVNLAYGTDTYRVTLFPPAWATYESSCVEGSIIFVEGRKDVSDQYGAGFIGNEVVTLPQLVALKEDE